MIIRPEVNEVTRKIIGAAIDVHRELGAGLLESAYESALVVELRQRELDVNTQVPFPLAYKGLVIHTNYRIDIVVEACVVVEVKSVEVLHTLHEAQTLTYMRISNCPLGLLINFNVPQLIQGLRRLIIDIDERGRAPVDARPLYMPPRGASPGSNPARDA